MSYKMHLRQNLWSIMCYNFFMKYVSCINIESGLVFLNNAVKPCAPGKEIFFMSDYKGEFLDVDKYLEVRNKYRNMFRSGQPPCQCQGCPCLQEKDWDDDNYVRYVGLNNHTKCSCNCVYCIFADDKKYWNNLKTYEIFPVLQDLAKRNLLKDTTIEVAGGECTEYKNKELERILDFVLENKFWLHLYSSGMFYSRAVETALNKSVANIIISVDSGTKETYKKIKRVNAHDKVWKNIANYIKKANIDESTNKGYVILKYIIFPGYNDTLAECSAFIEKCKQVNCKSIRISVEYDWFNENKGNIPLHIYELLDFFNKYTNDFKMEYIEDAVHLKNLHEAYKSEKKQPVI